MRFVPLMFACAALGLLSLAPAAKAQMLLYDFSLPANGSVGAFDIQLLSPDTGNFFVYLLSDPQVAAFTSGTPLDATNSVVGINVNSSSTLFGLALFTPATDLALGTYNYPADFFVFARTQNQTGTFLSSSGNVISNFTLSTATPTATLTVTAVPEPGSIALLTGLSLSGAAFLRRRKQARNAA